MCMDDILFDLDLLGFTSSSDSRFFYSRILSKCRINPSIRNSSEKNDLKKKFEIGGPIDNKIDCSIVIQMSAFIAHSHGFDSLYSSLDGRQKKNCWPSTEDPNTHNLLKLKRKNPTWHSKTAVEKTVCVCVCMFLPSFSARWFYCFVYLFQDFFSFIS